MHIFREKEGLQKQLKTFRSDGKSIGFVPTMGALHAGHLSLIKAALSSCDKVVVSIFVNPTQFDSPEDLEKYPRNLQADISQIAEVSDDVLVFSPSAEEIYGRNVISEEFSFDGLEHQMEGKFRKGHFDGVGTVVRRLFEIVQPDKAFFGEKDFQQLQIIRKLVEKLQLNIEVIGCPIDREDSGLARSSRNERLAPLQRQEASLLYAILQTVKADFGTKSAPEIYRQVRQNFNAHPNLKLEYFEIADAGTLKEIRDKEDGKKYRAFIAAYAGQVRLIDNIALN